MATSTATRPTTRNWLRDTAKLFLPGIAATVIAQHGGQIVHLITSVYGA